MLSTSPSSTTYSLPSRRWSPRFAASARVPHSTKSLHRITSQRMNPRGMWGWTDAAATIHSDIARGFIRCEVIRWSDFVECGTRAEAAKRGLQRLEGKEYVVEDGDVLNIRFNV